MRAFGDLKVNKFLYNNVDIALKLASSDKCYINILNKYKKTPIMRTSAPIESKIKGTDFMR